MTFSRMPSEMLNVSFRLERQDYTLFYATAWTRDAAEMCEQHPYLSEVFCVWRTDAEWPAHSESIRQGRVVGHSIQFACCAIPSACRTSQVNLRRAKEERDRLNRDRVGTRYGLHFCSFLFRPTRCPISEL